MNSQKKLIVSSTFDIDYAPSKITTNDIHLLIVKHAPDILSLLENNEIKDSCSDYYISPSSDMFDSILTQHATLKEYIDLYISNFSFQNVG